MNDTRDHQTTTQGAGEHTEDPERPGWCAACRRAFPCPATLTRAEARALAIRFGGGAG